MTFDSEHISVVIHKSFDSVNEFLAEPENFPKWASGLANGLQKVGEDWIAETPEGSMKVKFTEWNKFGVADHYVYPAPNVEIYIPLRVIPNGSGCEVLLTLFRTNHMSDEKFAADAEWVRKDLSALKKFLEANLDV